MELACSELQPDDLTMITNLRIWCNVEIEKYVNYGLEIILTTTEGKKRVYWTAFQIIEMQEWDRI